MPKVKRNCETCGKEFEVYPSQIKLYDGYGGRFCSKRCYGQSLAKKNRICEFCGNEYQGKGHRFCSKNCWYGFLDTKKLKLICGICGKEFLAGKYSGETTCSRECLEEKQNRFDPKLQSRRTRICVRCGKEFITLNTKKRFCSLDCFIKFRGLTSIESKIASALDFLGIRHQSQYRPNRCHYIFDEAISPNILIEIQGDYWHNLPGNAEKDERKADWAKEHGFEIVAIWEHEINKYTALALLKKRVLPLLDGRLATAKKIAIKVEPRCYDPIGIQLELPGISRKET